MLSVVSDIPVDSETSAVTFINLEDLSVQSSKMLIEVEDLHTCVYSECACVVSV